jgi:hypothetical protein
MTIRSLKMPPRLKDLPVGPALLDEYMLLLIRDWMAESPVRSQMAIQGLLDERFKAVEE